MTPNYQFQDLPGGKQAVAILTNTVTVVKKSAGRLCSVLVTTLGSAALPIYDASGQAGQVSGTVIGYVPASAAVGSFYVFNMPAANGIYVPAVSSGPAVTVSFN
jgi:hypothetical protein